MLIIIYNNNKISSQYFKNGEEKTTNYVKQ